MLEDKNYQKFREMALERKLGKLFLEGKLPPMIANTLIFDRSVLKADYIAPSMKSYKFVFKKKTNAFLLLEYLSHHSKQILAVKELVLCLNKPRTDGLDASDDRRVRDTVKELRSMSGLSKNKPDDCFAVGKGFGLKCSVVFI